MSRAPARGGRVLLTTGALGAALAVVLTGCDGGSALPAPQSAATAPLLAPIPAGASIDPPSAGGTGTGSAVGSQEAPAVAAVSIGTASDTAPGTSRPRRPSPTAPNARPATPAAAPTTADRTGGPVVHTAPAPRSTCARLAIRVIRGSAAFGREFAALQFTNTGTSTCRLNGYPAVALLRGGARIGTPSAPASAKSSTFLLAPGATAESQLNDYVSCQAPLSDTVRVVAPGSSQRTSRPAQLRACTLRVSALGEPQ